MNTSNNLRVEKGCPVLIDGTKHLIIKNNNINKTVWLENQSNGSENELPMSVFLKKYELGEVTIDANNNGSFKKAHDDVYNYSKKEIAVASRRKEYLTACIDESTGQLLSQNQCCENMFLLSERKKEIGKTPSYSSLVRWFNRYVANNHSLVSLIPFDRNKGNRRSHVSEKVSCTISHFIDELYLKSTKPSAEYAHEKLKVAMEINPEYKGERVPSLTTFYNYINKYDKYEIVKCRKGLAAAKRAFPLGSPVRRADNIRKVVELDHTKLDINLIDPDTCKVLGRPWLTIIIDTFSRMIYGYYLSFEAPSSTSCVKAIISAIIDKENLLAKYPDIKSDWPCSGIFQELRTDNGRDLQSEHFQRTLADFGTTIAYNPKGQPQGKGIVERFFRTLNNKLFNDVDGKTFRNYEEKGDYKSENGACLTIDDLHEMLVSYIVDNYHHSTHQGIETSPYEKWIENRLKMDALELPADINQLYKLMWKKKTAKVQKFGLSFANLKYNSVELMNIAKKYGIPTQLDIFYNEEDISSIHVLKPGTQDFIEVPCTKYNYTKNGISLEFHQQCRKESIKKMKDRKKLTEGMLIAERERRENVLAEANIRKARTTRAIKKEANTSHDKKTTAKPSNKINECIEDNVAVVDINTINYEV